MEYDRLGKNSKVFFFGITCLVVSLGLFLFCLYILPYFIWELSYNIPDFILDLLAKLQDSYHYTSMGSKTIIWLLFFIPCIITGLISYFVSHYIDSQNGLEPTVVEQEKLDGAQIKKEIKESASLGLKIFGLMVVIVVAILLLQYLAQSTV